MLNHTQQFGKLPSLAAFYYGVWQKFSTKPKGVGDYFPL